MSHDVDLSPQTLLVTAGRPPREPDAPLNTPIVPASAFHAGGVLEYAREGSPGMLAIEEAIGLLEGGRAITFASGVAAADAVLDLIPAGGRVIVPRHMYAGIAARLRDLVALSRLALERVDTRDLAAVAAALPGADLLWLETPSNPMLEVSDISAVAALARSAGVRTVVDNTFATPLRQRPLTLGADVVIHSATKALSGHSDLLLGAVVTTDAELAEVIRRRRVTMGASPGALECFLALRGMRTLALRVERSDASAAVLAQRLAEHPRVSRVHYPGFGSMVSIEVGSTVADAEQTCAATRVWVHSTSLGGVESMLERRRRWAMESSDVPENLVRLSVGIEDVEDLWSDLAGALG